MTQNPVIAQKTRQNFCDAFWQIYKTKPLYKITVREICEKAGYNRSTFYTYFKDVYDVLETIEDNLLSVPLWPRYFNFNRGELAEVLYEAYHRNDEYFSYLLGENGDPSFQYKVKRLFKARMRRNYMSKGIQDDQRFDFALEHLASSFLGMMIYVHSLDKEPNFETIASFVKRINHEGIITVMNDMDT